MIMTTLFNLKRKGALDLSSTRWARERPGLIIKPKSMAWRPYENLIDGELSNRVPGKVTGWIRFFRNNREPLRVELDLEGDFHQDIYGRMIRLSNPEPSDRTRDGSEGTYMEGFAPLQRGTAGDITAGFCLGTWSPEIAERLMARNESAWDDMGISGAEREVRRQDVLGQYTQLIEDETPYYAYAAYPYIEWYSEANGRVVLELVNSQLELVGEGSDLPIPVKTPKQLAEDQKRRAMALHGFLADMLEHISEENRRNGGDGNVFGAVI